MKVIAILALAEFRAGVRNRWIVVATLLLAALALALTLIGSAPAGSVGVGPFAVIVVSLSSLGVYLVPLIALLLAHDAIVGDVERGTMLLLLTYPVRRVQVLAGKFLGHVLVLAVATGLGYGAAGLTLALTVPADPAGWLAFAGLIGTSILLGAAFLALGYLVSTLVQERGTAAGLVIAVWVILVVVYDLLLLGGLLSDPKGGIPSALFAWLLVANPVDSYRLLNLTGFEGARLVSGLAGLGDAVRPNPLALIVGLALWVFWPLLLASWRFRRFEP